MQFLKVEYPIKIQVTIDGLANGFTNEVLEIEEGIHLVELKDVVSRTPSVKIEIKDTTPVNPLIITLEGIGPGKP